MAKAPPYTTTKGHKERTFICRCECGNVTKVRESSLKSGHTKSCGCLGREARISAITKHGQGSHPLYVVWKDIVQRCTNSNRRSYKDYGGRGISICEEWRADFGAFVAWAENNGYRQGLTIERINNNGNYEPSNCRWATMAEQGRNQRSNRRLTYNGKTLIISDWATETGISRSALYHRINKLGWSIEKALATPTRKMQRRNKK